MLIQFEKTSGRATGHCQPGRSHMREGASRNSIYLVPSISVGQRGGRLSESSPASRHPAAYSGSHLTVQGERPSHPFLSRCGAALRDVAAIAAAILLICATGIGFTAAIYLLLFVSL